MIDALIAALIAFPAAWIVWRLETGFWTLDYLAGYAAQKRREEEQ